MKSRRRKLISILATALCASCVSSGLPSASGVPSGSSDWHLNGGPAGDHYSPLSQIDASNVANLEVAWRFELGDGRLQAQPLIIDGVFYAPTPEGNLVALDAATGTLKWTFETGLPAGQPIRGLASHGQGADLRLMFSTRNFLYAIDASTGKPIPTFGDDGRINVQENLRGSADESGMYITSPGSVYDDLYIFSGRVSESTPASPGHIRAVDVNTGELRWTFHTIPHPGDFGAETWPENAYLTQGGANNWAGSVVDVQRGIVYLGTGSAADDFYGGERVGDNLFANSLIALDARTGRRLWHFQAVHHDLWDMDFNSAPVLLSVMRDGRKIDAVAATPKTGYVFIFDRVTGEPLFPIDEVPVAASTVPGEVASPTQPVPRLPAPLARTSVTASDLTTRTPGSAEWARGVFQALNGAGKQFVPMTLGKDTLVFAGFTGGVGWGGMAADPNGILYANASDVPGISMMIESQSLLTSGVGQRTYQQQCAACHGAERQGAPPEFPALNNLDGRLSDAAIAEIIRNGRGRMPAFPNLPAETVTHLISFLKTGQDVPGGERPAISLQGRFAPSETLYTSNGNRHFIDADGYPGVKPPWGTLNAIDMNTGQYLWRIPFGTTQDLGMEFGGRNTGGAVVTASGLLFIGATADRKFRAYESRTGRLLWETTMSAPGEATPAVYMANGRQFVAIAATGRSQPRSVPAPANAAAAGGGLAAEGAGHSAQGEASASPAGNAYIAYALRR